MTLSFKRMIITGAAAAICGQALAYGSWHEQYKYQVPASQNLRGYGAVSTESATWNSTGSANVRVMTFACANDKKASTLIGKFLADLTLSTGVKEIQIKVGDKTIPAKQTSSDAVFVGCLDGMTAKIISSDSLTALKDFLQAKPDIASGAVKSAPYPAFLDRFDRYGWGAYGLGGWSNYHGWMSHCEPKDKEKDPTEDLDFMAKYKFRFEPWLDPSHFDNSDGIIKNTESDWMIQEANRKGLPVSFRVYGASGGCDWTARRFPEYADQHSDFLMSGWHGPRPNDRVQPHMSWKTDYYRYMAARTMDKMRKYVDNPMVMGWMNPVGELQHDNWYAWHADFSPAAKQDWHNWLKKNDVSLKELSVMYGRQKQPFSAWDQVFIPEYATFAGLPGEIEDLSGNWFCRKAGQPDQGMKEQWWKTSTDLKDWRSMKLPGNDRIYEVLDDVRKYKNKKSPHASWFKRTFELDSKQLAGGRPIYLYWFPVGLGTLHAGKNAVFHKVFINGKKAGEIGTWGALDIRKLLKTGSNEITLQLISPIWNGRIFLSTEKPSVYPYLGKERNKLWTLWRAWTIESKYRKSAEILDAMRQIDGERPIKFMAPVKMGSERWLDLGQRYGTWGHFTGEGIWFFPWYKRYGYLYGLPGTCETAGPSRHLVDQFNSFRRIFLAGLNSHDAVFLTQTYTRNPDLRKFWIDHNPVLKRLGRFDIDGPQILLLRSSRGTVLNPPLKPFPELGIATRKIQNPWDWDIGRGTLQTLGYSYLYLGDKGVKDGKMAGYKVMFDVGNETLSKQTIAGIVKWVKAGGTFITLPFTGRNSTLEPDTWPIESLTGCKVAKLRKPGTGKIIIGKNQNVLKKLAGHSFDDNGSAIDSGGNELNMLSTELKPGPDCEVLARFENGAPAIVRRKLGKGQVIVLGSAFFKGSEDRMGIWWPEPRETEFLADLLEGVGFGKPSCETDDRMVFAQPYRSINGLNYVATLVSWHDDKTVDVTLTLRLPEKPDNIVSYGVDGIRKLNFNWKDGEATIKVNMPPKEVKVISADIYSHTAAVDHWWNRQQHYWFELQKPAIDFSPYSTGKFEDPTLDLSRNAKLTTEKPDSNWTGVDFNDAKWQPCNLEIMNFEGAEANKPIWVRKTFEVPAKWQSQGGSIYLITAKWTGGRTPYQGNVRMYLNGKLMHDYKVKTNYLEFDIDKLLNKGKNVVAFEFKGDKKYQGFLGDLYLYHRIPPERSIDLAGVWDGKDKKGKEVSLKLPGDCKYDDMGRKVFIPEEWKNKYNIRLYIDGDRGILGAYVNNRLVRRHHHRFGGITDIDISHRIKFGQDNLLELYGHGKIKEITLCLYKK